MSSEFSCQNVNTGVARDINVQNNSKTSAEKNEAKGVEIQLADESNSVMTSVSRESAALLIPPTLQQLYSQTQCTNKNDAIWIVIHSLMLESGFGCIQETAANHNSMPDEWKGLSHYTGRYYPIDISSNVSCKLTGLPMGSKIIIQGQVHGRFETKQIHINADDYVIALDKDCAKCYKNLHRLSILVKDAIILPLLQELVSELGLPQSFGFIGLNFELKLKILSYLDLASLVKLGEVNKQMNNIYKDPYLWKRLFISTYGESSNSDLSQDWLGIYKEKYKMKKEYNKKLKSSTFVVPSCSWYQPPRVYPPLAPVYPNHGIIGGDFDLDPHFPGLIDPLRRRPSSGLEILLPSYDPVLNPRLPHPSYDPILNPGLLLERGRNNQPPQHWFGRAMGNIFWNSN